MPARVTIIKCFNEVTVLVLNQKQKCPDVIFSLWGSSAVCCAWFWLGMWGSFELKAFLAVITKSIKDLFWYRPTQASSSTDESSPGCTPRLYVCHVKTINLESTEKKKFILKPLISYFQLSGKFATLVKGKQQAWLGLDKVSSFIYSSSSDDNDVKVDITIISWICKCASEAAKL